VGQLGFNTLAVHAGSLPDPLRGPRPAHLPDPHFYLRDRGRRRPTRERPDVRTWLLLVGVQTLGLRMERVKREDLLADLEQALE
jgi:O-acetylhomoserine/O-acetylserine sulfhydrylase-like pyridoxal-dependent enzyme